MSFLVWAAVGAAVGIGSVIVADFVSKTSRPGLGMVVVVTGPVGLIVSASAVFVCQLGGMDFETMKTTMLSVNAAMFAILVAWMRC
jgi:hypothetical protein